MNWLKLDVESSKEKQKQELNWPNKGKGLFIAIQYGMFPTYHNYEFTWQAKLRVLRSISDMQFASQFVEDLTERTIIQNLDLSQSETSNGTRKYYEVKVQIWKDPETGYADDFEYYLVEKTREEIFGSRK